MRKGQMEILGFIIIVLLIIAGVIFYIKFMKPDNTQQIIQESEQNLEVSNLLNSIRLQTICENTQMNDVIKTCINNNGFECDKESCLLIKEELPKIIEAYDWQEGSYEFYIGDEIYTKECDPNKIQNLPDDATISGKEIKLVYCYE